jgi:hypothetical protein
MSKEYPRQAVRRAGDSNTWMFGDGVFGLTGVAVDVRCFSLSLGGGVIGGDGLLNGGALKTDRASKLFKGSA